MTEDSNGSGKEHIWMWVGRIAQMLIIPVLAFQLAVFSFMSQGPRFTAKDAAAMRLELEGMIDAKVSTLPPEWVRSDLVDLKAEVKDLRNDFSEMRTEMNGRLRSIETLLRDN